MHMCEAMLAAFEATAEERYLERAHTLARRVCVELAAPAQGLGVGALTPPTGSTDWEYNRADPKNLFRPYGYLPGHFVEWSKLLLILQRHRPEPWQAETARRLFDTALERSWDEERGGMHYTFAPDGTILDTDRYYWVLAETVAAAAVLAVRTGEQRYWELVRSRLGLRRPLLRRSRPRRLVPGAGSQRAALRRQEEPAEQDRLPSARRVLRDPAQPVRGRGSGQRPPLRGPADVVRSRRGADAQGRHRAQVASALTGQLGEALKAAQRGFAVGHGVEQLGQRGDLHRYSVKIAQFGSPARQAPRQSPAVPVPPPAPPLPPRRPRALIAAAKPTSSASSRSRCRRGAC